MIQSPESREFFEIVNALESDNHNEPITEYIHRASQLMTVLEEDQHITLISLISSYCNPHCSWTTGKASEEAIKFLQEWLPRYKQRFYDAIFPGIVALPSRGKTSAKGYKRTGLRPGLGFSSHTQEDDKRNAWKDNHVKVLSQVYGLMLVDLHRDQDIAWPIVLAFILNVLDDSDPYYKLQGCFLLQWFLDNDHEHIVIKCGLVDVLVESLSVCLHYLPNLTPPAMSLSLLSATYPLLFRLLPLKTHLLFTAYLEVLEKHVLASISHIYGRDVDSGKNAIISYLLHQCCILITESLKEAVLACLPRLLFSLNRLITDPFLIDTDGGVESVNAALEVHQCLLRVFKSDEGKCRLLSYKYDFVGCWAVVMKRVGKFSVGDTRTKELLKGNLAAMTSLAESVSEDALKQLNEDLQALREKGIYRV